MGGCSWSSVFLVERWWWRPDDVCQLQQVQQQHLQVTEFMVRVRVRVRVRLPSIVPQFRVDSSI